MIKLLVFLGLSALVWILILLSIIKFTMKVGTQPYKVRSTVLLVSNTLAINLSILSIIYHIVTLPIIIVMCSWIIPIFFGDLYYDNKNRKISRKESEERGKVLDEVIRSFENKCNIAGVESGLNTVKKNGLLTLDDGDRK